MNQKITTQKEFLTTIEWQREKSLEFSNLRLNVDKKRKSFKKTITNFELVCKILIYKYKLKTSYNNIFSQKVKIVMIGSSFALVQNLILQKVQIVTTNLLICLKILFFPCYTQWNRLNKFLFLNETKFISFSKFRVLSFNYLNIKLNGLINMVFRKEL